MNYILFDIGGTKTRVAISEDLATLRAVESFKTPVKFEDGVKKIIATAKKLGAEAPMALAGGIRGPLMEDKSGIENDAVLQQWAGQSLVEAESGDTLPSIVVFRGKIERRGKLDGADRLFGMAAGLGPVHVVDAELADDARRAVELEASAARSRSTAS